MAENFNPNSFEPAAQKPADEPVLKDPGHQGSALFRLLFELSPLPIVLTNLETDQVLDVNGAFCETTQYAKKDLLGKKLLDLGLYTGKDRDAFSSQLMATGEVRGFEMDCRLKDGTIVNTDVYAGCFSFNKTDCILSVFYNKTQEKMLERQFIEAQKMEAIGKLAGGIAHDFNNLLMGIEGNVGLIRMDMGEAHYTNHKLDKISAHVKSCNQLTKQLLGYVRQEIIQIVPLDLNLLVEDTAESFKRTRKQITIETDLDPALKAIEVDAVQIRQLLYNLFINAADAMPDGGKLHIKTANINREDIVGKAYRMGRRHYVSMVITDTGIGMDQQTLAHLFEPFFTTKKSGQGTGLGLASVYGIVKGYAGYIDVESTPGQGTAFQVYFPASTKQAGMQKKPAVIPTVGKGNLLLVDDEADVLQTTSQLLEKIGYTVFSASSGAQAIEILGLKSVDIDLIILDLVMPGMNGGATYQRIRSMNPGVKVLLWSGYHSDVEVADLLQQGCVGFVQKPVNIVSLSKTISDILGNQPMAGVLSGEKEEP